MLSVCFFFSSRRRHTRYWRDWSSDVCSSDLFWVTQPCLLRHVDSLRRGFASKLSGVHQTGSSPIREWIEALGVPVYSLRSEERRVGKECRSRWSPYH